jgi:short-subunit dehydrogenase
VNNFEWSGRVAVITGASSGIGAALARVLAKRGAAVALVARREAKLREVADEIARAGGRASVHVCDVSERARVDACVRDVLVAQNGRIDLLVNAAGFVHHGLLKDHPPDQAERMVRTNLLGAFHCMQAVLPALRARRESWIVNVSSFAALVPQPDEALYAATKAALSSLSEAAHYEFAPLGIHVMTVHPVLVRTEMFTPEVMARMPRGSEQRSISAEDFSERTLRALERRRRSVTIPRAFGAMALLRALAPGAIGRAVARTRLSALDDVEK